MTDAAIVNHTNPDFVAEPYPVFRALREHGALHHHPDWGVRIAVSHEACSTILRHRDFGRIWNDAEPSGQFEAFNSLHRLNMLENDQEHDRLRAVASPLFHRRHIRELRSTITEIVERYIHTLCERIQEDGSADVMEHVARPLPVDIIATLLDFPRSDRHLLQSWSNQIVTMYEPETSFAARRTAEEAAQQFRDYVSDLIVSRRRQPGQNLLSHLATTLRDPQSRISEPELIANYVLLLMAGHEASVNGIGNAIAALHAHPEQWHLFRAHLTRDETRLNTAVDELLRYDTPNQLFERTATAPTKVCGHQIEQGESITVLLGSANRDPDVYSEPDRLDLTRSPNPHLALGAGMHYCLGAPLARLEIGTTLAALAHYMPNFALTTAPPRHGAFAIRGFSQLSITAPTPGQGSADEAARKGP